MAQSVPPKPSITDSIWFWIYLFCTTGLIGLVVVAPKIERRQLMEERSYQGRRRGLEQVAGRAPTTEMSTPDQTLFRLWPLYLLFGTILVFAWCLLWWQHFRRRHGTPRLEVPP